MLGKVRPDAWRQVGVQPGSTSTGCTSEGHTAHVCLLADLSLGGISQQWPDKPPCPGTPSLAARGLRSEQRSRVENRCYTGNFSGHARPSSAPWRMAAPMCSCSHSSSAPVWQRCMLLLLTNACPERHRVFACINSKVFLDCRPSLCAESTVCFAALASWDRKSVV